MSSTVTKRQQARNERALQDITRSIPGNDRCADCNAPNPSWASWNLGIFLCMRCAALHRKLGTHISKVKSLSMDSWTVEQVENMKKIGNTASNQQLNPRRIAAKIPVDVDEVDAAIEKHIRLKYEQRAFSTETRSAPTTRQNTGSTATGSDEPPPLPPKPTKHWGFSTRSASSSLPRTKKYDLPETPIASAITVEEPRGKRSFFGMRVTSVGNNFDQKLNMLKEMGFTNAKQNQDILKNTDGSLDRAVEILSRLHESVTPEPDVPRTYTPVSRTTTGGLRMTKTRASQPDSAWDVKESKRSATAPLPPLPTRSSSTEPVTNTWNPFLQPQPAQDLSASMQNLSIAQPSQPPQAYSQTPLSVQTTGNPWGLYMQPQQAMSVPAISQQYQPSPMSSTNPFFQTASPQSITSSNPWSQQMTPQTMTPSTPHSNPFGIPMLDNKQQMPQQSVQQTFTQPPVMTPGSIASPNPFQHFAGPAPQQPSPFAPQSATSPPAAFSPQPTGFPMQTSVQHNAFMPQNGSPSPFPQSAQSGYPQPGIHHAATFPQTASPPAALGQYPPPQMGAFPQQAGSEQQSGILPQATGMPRHDKSSILALYNYPQAAPQRQLQTLPEDSVPAPVMSPQSGNPFAAQPVSITAHSSRESRDFQSFQQDGRHSPDAFSGLSSRFTR